MRKFDVSWQVLSCRKSVTAALTLRGGWIYTFSTGNATISSGEKKKKTRGIGTVLHSCYAAASVKTESENWKDWKSWK